MAEIYIHIPGGEQLSIVPEASSLQDWALMGDNKLSLSFQRYECLILPAGAWCEFDGVIFYLLQEYKPTMIHSHLWQYNVAFVDGASWLGVTTALKTIDEEDAPLFTLTAPAAEHAAIIVSNLNRRLGATMWKVGSVIDTPNITIEYTGKYCGAVLQEIVDDQNTEWWVDGTTLNIGRAEFGSLIELGYRDGLLGDITVTQADNMSSYRTLYPVGSTRNILPTEYGHDRLQLPNGQKSVMMNPAGVAELVEEAAFAGIYPRYKGKVTGVSTSIGQSNDGSQYLIYIVADTAIPFNPNEYEMPGLVKRITFQSGELMGAEFEVNYNPASNEFELITQFQENGSQLPGGMLIPQVGDEYVVWNISMPAEYYPLAEQELLEAAESFAAASTRESNVYKVKLDYIDVQERGLSLRPGQKVRLHSLDYFPEQGYYDSRITRVTRPVNYPGEYTIDVSAVRVVGSLARLQTSLAAATTKVNSLSNTVQTVVQTVSNAVTLTGNQRVQGVKNFVDGIRLNGSPIIEYHPAINTWLFRGNILAEGGMAAFSNINGFTPSTITEAVLIDNRTIKRGADGLLYVDFDEGGSGGGSLDEEQLEEYLKPYAKTADVANTYATIASLSAVTSRLNDFLSGSDTDTIINKWSELETFLAGLAETDNLATILSGKANKATTLAGYGITDAYTKSHIDSNFVAIGTKQQITGEKDFVGGFKVNGGLVEYNATLKAWVFNGDLLVTGGVSAFSNISGFKPSTITEAVLIDNKTIKLNADGLLYAVAQETGGINEEQLDDYLTFNGYATQDWVTGRGYITASALEPYALKTAIPTSLKNPNALSWSGYSSGSYDGSSAKSITIPNNTNQLTNGAGFITASASITGNAATSDRLVEEVVTDLNNATAGRIFTMTSGYGSTVGNKPDEGWVTGLTLQYAQNGIYRRQLAFCDDLYFRKESNANWGAWRKILDDSNYSEYALPITGGTVNGNVRINKFLAVGAASSSTNTSRAQIHLVSSGANPCDLYLGADDALYWSITARNAADAGGFNKAFALYDVTNSAYRLIVLPNGNIGIGTTSPETRLHVSGYAKITNDLYLGGVLRNANATWLLGEETSNGALAIGSATFAQDRYLNNLNGKLRLTAEGGVEAQLTYLDSNPTLGNLDAKGVLRLTPTNGFGLYSWVRNTGDGYIQVGSDSRYATPKSFNLIMQALGGNVGIGTASPTSKLHAVSSSGWGVTFDGGSKSKIVGAHADGFGMLVMSTTPTTSDSYIFRVWQGSLTGASGSGTAVLDVRSNGVVNIGGNILATGGITAQNSSDRRLKRNLRKFNASKVLMSLGAVWEYEYIDSEVQKNHIYEGTHYGLIYQHVKGTTLDVMCHEREDGMGALNYIHPKFISLIAGATMENISEVEKLKRKIRHLEAKVKQLENRV